MSTDHEQVLSTAILQSIMPKARVGDLNKYLDALNEEMPGAAIHTPLRIAHFIAQLAHESGNFRYHTENLNYSAKALRGVFGRYFPTDEKAEAYARQPEKIASRVYARRMGNGDEASGEGWKYKGRGLIQLTGKDNYSRCGAALGLDLVNEPEQVAENPNTAVAAAAWFWNHRNLNAYADQDDVKAITKRINGGYHGLEDRTHFLNSAKEALGV